MDKLKQWVALTALGIIAIGAAGWFLLISPKHSEAADLRAQATQRESANRLLADKLTQLKAQQKELPAQEAKLAAVAAKIPDNPALPALVRALTKAADAAGVELVSMAPGQPVPVAAPAPVAKKPTAAEGTATGTTATKPRAAAPSAAAGSLQSVGLSVNIVGGYFQVEQFLDQLESLTRAFKVSSFTVSPGGNPVKLGVDPSVVETGRSLTAVINGQVYMALGRATIPTATTGK